MYIFKKRTDPLTAHRAELAALETQLINSLLGLAPAPIEVDSKQVEICGLSLKRKRARSLARFEEGLDTTCSTIKPEMENYFRAHPGPHPSGPHADFKQYKKFLSGRVYRQTIEWVRKRLSRR